MFEKKQWRMVCAALGSTSLIACQDGRHQEVEPEVQYTTMALSEERGIVSRWRVENDDGTVWEVNQPLEVRVLDEA